MTFFERLQALMDSHNLSQKQLANNTNIRQTTISEWKKNGNLPTGETAIKLAQYFNITLDYLLTGKDNDISSDEFELLSNYRSLPDHDKSMISVMIAAMSAESHKTSGLEIDGNQIGISVDFDAE